MSSSPLSSSAVTGNTVIPKQSGNLKPVDTLDTPAVSVGAMPLSPRVLPIAAAGTLTLANMAPSLSQLNTVLDQARLAGYGEELAVSIAESFMPDKKLNANKFLSHGPMWFRALCGISMGYIVGDVITKTALAYKEANQNALPKSKSLLYAGAVFLDRGAFQAISTWLMPIYLIKFLSHQSQQAILKVAPKLKGTVPLKVMTLAAGFLPSEFLAHALDSATHAALDKSIRPWMGLPPALNTHTQQSPFSLSRFMPEGQARRVLSQQTTPMNTTIV